MTALTLSPAAVRTRWAPFVPYLALFTAMTSLAFGTSFAKQLFPLVGAQGTAALRVGLAAFPVESRWGYHVVCVDAIESGEELAFDQVRQRISDYLELQVRQRELQQYLQGLQERYEVRGLAAIEAEAA